MRSLSLVLAFVPLLAFAQPVLIKNIDTTSQTSGGLAMGSTMVSGNTTFFTLFDPARGRELWKTDGTPAGTSLVVDLHPGPGQGMARLLAPIDGGVLLAASDSSSATELWKSDGTAAGTVLVADVAPGAETSSPFFVAQGNGVTFFRATTVEYGNELWKTDGTAAGTLMVKDVAPGAATSLALGGGVGTFFNGSLYFEANTGLYVSDGSPGSATLLSSFRPLSFASLGPKLYFIGVSGSSRALLVTDGTSGGTTVVVGLISASVSPLVSNGTRLFFRGDIGGGQKLYVSDGTAGGTFGQPCPITVASTAVPVVYNADVYFAADGAGQGVEVWHTDGTTCASSGNLTPGAASSAPRNLVVANGALYLTTAQFNTKLWRIDATKLATAVQEAGSDVVLVVATLAPGRHGVIWVDAASEVRHASTVATTLQTFTAPPSSYPESFATLGSSTYFSATSGEVRELWKTDGTGTGTLQVTNLSPAWQDVANVTTLGNRLVFTAFDSVGDGLDKWWASDGTDAGTALIGAGFPYVTALGVAPVASGGYLYYFNDDTPAVWRTDGTAAGTTPLLGGLGLGLMPLGTSMIVAIDLGGTDAPGFYRVDGTPGATPVKLADIPAGGSTVGFAIGAAAGTKLVFPHDDGVHGWEPWVTDGTAAGTLLLKDLAPGQSFASPFFSSGGLVYFGADDGAHGRELWKTDGTAAGTQLVIDLAPGKPSGVPFTTTMAEVAGHVLFLGWDAAHGVEWHTLDGALLADIVPGPGSLEVPASMTVVHRTLFFNACTPALGCELWKTDGTVANTVPTFDFAHGPLSSNPHGLTPHGLELWLNAADATGDAELYKYAYESTPPQVSVSVTGTLATDAGWYSSDVTVRFDVDDPESPVTSTTGCDAGVLSVDTPETSFTCSATSAGGVAITSVTVRRDATPPVLTCPANITVQGLAGALVVFGRPTAVDAIDGEPKVTLSHDIGAFPVGVTHVTATARDFAGNVSTCGFDVTVGDTQPPLLSCPADRVLRATSADGAKASFVANALDLLDPDPMVTYSVASGSTFAVGDTEVTVTATDASGNARTCKFIVTVEAQDTPGTPPKGCGCGAAEGSLAVLGLAALLARRRRP